MNKAEEWANKTLEEHKGFIEKFSKANFDRIVVFGEGIPKDEELDMWIEHCKERVEDMGLKDKTGMSLVDAMKPLQDLKNAEMEKANREAIKKLNNEQDRI